MKPIKLYIFTLTLGLLSSALPAKAIFCTIGSACANPANQLTITSPAGGESWVIGNTYTITWSNINALETSFQIELTPPAPSCLSSNPPCSMMTPAPYILTASTTPSQTSFSWKIDKDIYGRTIPVGQYTINLYSPTGEQSATSNSFNLVSSSQNITPPILTQISPTSGPVDTQVTITGSNFTSTNNTIKFGSITVGTVNSNGNNLTFTIPSGSQNNCIFNEAACTNVALMILSGNYSVTVTNSNGISNTLTFSVTNGTVYTNPNTNSNSTTATSTSSQYITTSSSPFTVYTPNIFATSSAPLGLKYQAPNESNTPTTQNTQTPNTTSGQSSTQFNTNDLVVDNSGTIYLIYGQTKIPFTSLPAFLGSGYKLKNVIKGDVSNYFTDSYQIKNSNEMHSWGSWLLYGKTVYYSSENGMIPVPSWEVFLNNGGQSKYLLKANSADISVIKKSTLHNLVKNDPRIK